jgi:hypothetical protein
LAGAGSCSGRACHGGLEPADPPGVQQNEYTTWLLHDKHARSYAVLTEERGRRMATNLGIEDASQDVRCLACHVTPAAAQAADRVDLHREGVGCESCHGAANDSRPWLETHAADGRWKKTPHAGKRKLYEEYGMTALMDVEVQARTCAGCHVGAPAGKDLPARDLNHDLMAAGHPRLTFELAVFQANQPPHRRLGKEDKYKDDPGYPAKVWAVGRVVAAQAALQLLRDRAGRVQDGRVKDEGDSPWPEFAEYGCFACHADLRNDSWRRQTDYFTGRTPGALPYNVWYSTALPGKDKGVMKAFEALGQEMNKPIPNPEEVKKRAYATLKRLQGLLETTRSRKGTADDVSQWLAALQPSEGRVKTMSWDEAQQLVLAAAALHQAERAHQGQSRPDPKINDDLQELYRTLAFPDKVESPRDFRRTGKLDGQIKALFTDLKRGRGAER